MKMVYEYYHEIFLQVKYRLYVPNNLFQPPLISLAFQSSKIS